MTDRGPPARSTRALLLALGVWVVLTAAGTVLHHWIWSAELQPGVEGVSPLMQSFGNVVHMLIAPGWLLLRMIGRQGPTGAWTGPLVANGIGWACWIVGVSFLLSLRSRWLRPEATATSPIPGVPDVAAPGPNLSRRRFLVDGSLAAAAVGGGGLFLKAEFSDAWGLRVASYRVPIRGLPRGLDGLRAAMLADTHLGPRIPAEFIRRAVQMAMDLRPDLFLLCGDYIHNGRAFINPAAALFEPLIKTTRPVLAVRGNHDWYGDGVAMGRALEAIGVTVIDNRRVFVDTASGRVVRDLPAGGSLAIIGLGDVLTDWVDAAAAFGGLAPDLPRVVLAHNPDTAEVISGRMRMPQGGWTKGYRPCMATPRIDAMLCGHTHGGQVRLPLLGTPLIPCFSGQKYAGGMIRGPGFPVIVSRGVGMSILPIRFGVPPEVVEMTFVRA